MGSDVKGEPALRLDRGRPSAPAPEASGAPGPEPFETLPVLKIEPPAPPRMLIERLFLAEDLNALVAPKGQGKTVTLLTAAIATALGRPCFGTLPVSKVGSVLLLVPEDGVAATRMALDAMAAGAELGPGEHTVLGELLHVVVDDEHVDLTRHIRRLRATCEQRDTVLIVLDPIRNLLGASDENDANVAGQVADELRRELCRGAGVTVALSMHRRKLSRERGADPELGLDDARGSSAWVAACRTIYSVSQSSEARTIQLRCLAANRFRPDDAHHTLRLEIAADPENPARWTSCSLVDADDGSSTALTPGSGRPLKDSERAMLSALHDPSEPDLALAWSAWCKRSGQPERSFSNLKTRLQAAGLVEGVPTGRRGPGGHEVRVYRISPAGLNALAGGQVRGDA